MKKILFIIDKIELQYFEFNDLVTNFWLIKEFLTQGNDVCITTIPMLSLKNNIAYANCYNCFKENNNIFYKKELLTKEIDSFELVIFLTLLTQRLLTHLKQFVHLTKNCTAFTLKNT